MFMGVGILKVKSLFRKLRKLALRYGGVIVFFDEADALGSRGMLAQQRPGFPRGMTSGAVRRRPGATASRYLSPESQWMLARDAWARTADPEPHRRGATASSWRGHGRWRREWARCRPCSPSCPA